VLNRQALFLGPSTTVDKMSTQYDQGKLSAHDATQTTEHHRTPGGLAANMSPERRQQVEKTLKRKLDARCSLFILLYIMNCKSKYIDGVDASPNFPS